MSRQYTLSRLADKDARIAELTEALKPFANATVTPDGHIIGLMREDIARARAALAAVGEKKL